MTTHRAPRLLAVHAHPDDETLSTGALLATWAAAGGPVTVVTCTRGERGEVIGAALAHLEGDGPALAAHREHELAAALAALGVTDHAFLDALPLPPAHPAPVPDGAPAPVPDGAPARYTDSGMVWVAPGRAGAAPDSGPTAFARADVEEAARRLAAFLRLRRPDVVVTYEPGGGYGHPDHVQAHRVTTRAVALATDASADLPGEPLAPPVVLWAAVDADDRARALAELAHLTDLPPGVHLPGPERVPPSAAVRAGEVDLRVDVHPVLDRVLGALHAHATQVQAVAAVPGAGTTARTTAGTAVGRLALSDGVLAPLLAREAYRRASGDLAVAWPAGVTVRDAGARPVPVLPEGAGDTLAPVSVPVPTERRPGRGAAVARLVGCLLLGVVVGIVGTGVHRASQPWGLVLALGTVVSAGVLARAWARGGGVSALAVGLAATVLAMAYVRPGEDVLVADETVGYVWLAAPLVLVAVVLALPRRMFGERPLGRPRDG